MRWITLMAVALLLAWAPVARPDLIILDATARGMYLDNNLHLPGPYGIGEEGNEPDFTEFLQFRNYFIFDLSSVGLTVTSATLEVTSGSYVSGDPTETYEIHDVTISLTSITNGTAGSAAFNDFADGSVYGTTTLSSGPITTIVSIALNAAAVSNINAAAGGMWAMGGYMTTITPLVSDEIGFGGNGSGQQSRLVLFAIPEPSTLALVSLAGLATAAFRKRASKRT
jgi:hypothetical protein